MLLLTFAFLHFACANSEALHSKIVGGTAADIKEIPYQVSLRYNGEHYCGGAIISYKVILTAAHCVDKAFPSQVSVYVGSSYLNKQGKRYRVASIRVHDQYKRTSSENDIAIIKLRQNLRFGVNVLPIALPSLNEEISPGTSALVSGWGHTQEEGGISVELRKVAVSIIDRSICQQKFIKQGTLTDKMVCAGAEKGGKDACQGDSGGPLAANGKLQGIVSWGVGCAREEYPGVYTQVSKYRRWIKRYSGV